MSNHWGSYMLNEVLHMLEANNFFAMLGKTKSREFVAAVVELSEQKYDCNRMEILEEIGERLGICGHCLKRARKFADGMCVKCQKSYSD